MFVFLSLSFFGLLLLFFYKGKIPNTHKKPALFSHSFLITNSDFNHLKYDLYKSHKRGRKNVYSNVFL